MLEPENSLFSRLDSGVTRAQEQQRLKALSELGLLEAETIPVFEEATQTAAHLLDSPICILGFLDSFRHCFKSAVGLSRIGLMNQLAQERQLPRQESFCNQVVENQQVLVINDALTEPNFAKSLLVQHYGIRAYLGVPLVTAASHCLGALEVMDLEPRNFTMRDIEFLQLIARWSMSEFERNWLIRAIDEGTTYETLPLGKGQETRRALILPEADREQEAEEEEKLLSLALSLCDPADDTHLLSTIQVKLELLQQITQELRTPLTSVLGMASVLSREIYGPLTNKQKEYLEIIQHSGKYLLSLVNEISELGTLDNSTQEINLTSVDIEMLCQQVSNSLAEAANRREQKIRLSVEPGLGRIWIVDKEKVRQLLYYLVLSVTQAATTGSMIRIHVAHKSEGLNFAISVSHPWLGEGLSQIDPGLYRLPGLVIAPSIGVASSKSRSRKSEQPLLPVAVASSVAPAESAGAEVSVPSKQSAHVEPPFNRSREIMCLLLSCHFAELHGGQISVQKKPESGYRYVVILPDVAAVEENL